MKSLRSKVDEFLNCHDIAVVGVSNTSPQEAVNFNFQKLKEKGYKLFPVNPHHEKYDGEKCYKDISSIGERVEAALIFTSPKVTPGVVDDCLKSGIKNIWIHRSFGQGSCSKEASAKLKDKEEINFIDGACPMMFIDGADWAHKCFKTIMKWTGRLPN